MHRLLYGFLTGLMLLGIVIGTQNPEATKLRQTQSIQPSVTLQVGLDRPRACPLSAPELTLPKFSLQPADVAVIINDRDPQSRAVAAYYQQRRRIPTQNLVHVAFSPQGDAMDPARFEALKTELDAALNPQIQALALSFSRPFRVGCMSITSALALGYDRDFCEQSGAGRGPAGGDSKGCRLPKLIASYNTASSQPFTDLGIRPAMMLAGDNTAGVKALIDRGVQADGSQPQADIYLVKTPDAARNVRSGAFQLLAQTWPTASGWRIHYLDLQDAAQSSAGLTGADQVLAYLTGLPRVPQIASNHYLPGAVADHLTSAAGFLSGSSQMTVLEWLQAGVTGSYGAVSEPCNYLEKFPDAEIVTTHYYRGETLLEAYWKSVASPQEGLFVGDPLASPMQIQRRSQNGQLHLQLSSLKPGHRYQFYGADTPEGPYSPVADPIQRTSDGVVAIALGCDKPYYRLVDLGPLSGQQPKDQGIQKAEDQGTQDRAPKPPA